jgi:RimJ/RimL family protein N-acetyltransferase
VVAFGFEQLGLERIHAIRFAGNPASGRVLAKAGFVVASRRLARRFGRRRAAIALNSRRRPASASVS